MQATSALWPPELCTSPLHSAGLSMDNPFEMFNEVGKSLRWFSLSRTRRDKCEQDKMNTDKSSVFLAEEIESYDSESSSILDSWNRCDEDSVEANHENQNQDFHVEEEKQADHRLRIEEIPASVVESYNVIKEENAPIKNKDPVSQVVRSFFNAREDAPTKLDVNNSNSVDMLALQKRVESMESENLRMKKELQRLSKLLKEREEEASRFAQEKASWERDFKSMQAFQLQREELLEEVRREKRLVDKQLQLLPHLVALPNKAERKEMADLKAKLMDVHEEHVKKEARLQSTIIRLRKHVKELSGCLKEKKEEIKRYEKLLLDKESRVIKAVECSSHTTSVGCRIAGSLFRPDKRGKQKASDDKESSLEDTLAASAVSDVVLKDRTEHPCVRASQRQSIVFTDGTREEEYQDGLACVYFANGDIKNSLADGTIEYYYAEIDTWHTTRPDGVEVFYYADNQVEEHWPNGHKRVIYPDGTSESGDL